MCNSSTSVNENLGFPLFLFKLCNCALLIAFTLLTAIHSSQDQNKKQDSPGVLASVLSGMLFIQATLHLGRQQYANATILAVSGLCAYEISSQTNKNTLRLLILSNVILFAIAAINYPGMTTDARLIFKILFPSTRLVQPLNNEENTDDEENTGNEEKTDDEENTGNEEIILGIQIP